MNTPYVVTRYHENNRNFIIVKDENGYWGIEDIYLDSEGRTKQKIDGLTGYLSHTLDICLKRIHSSVQFQMRVDAGEDPMDVAKDMIAEIMEEA